MRDQIWVEIFLVVIMLLLCWFGTVIGGTLEKIEDILKEEKEEES